MIDSLPPELIIHLLPFVGYDELLALSSLNRKWRRTIVDEALFYRHMCLQSGWTDATSAGDTRLLYAETDSSTFRVEDARRAWSTQLTLGFARPDPSPYCWRRLAHLCWMRDKAWRQCEPTSRVLTLRPQGIWRFKIYNRIGDWTVVTTSLFSQGVFSSDIKGTLDCHVSNPPGRRIPSFSHLELSGGYAVVMDDMLNFWRFDPVQHKKGIGFVPAMQLKKPVADAIFDCYKARSPLFAAYSIGLGAICVWDLDQAHAPPRIIPHRPPVARGDMAYIDLDANYIFLLHTDALDIYDTAAATWLGTWPTRRLARSVPSDHAGWTAVHYHRDRLVILGTTHLLIVLDYPAAIRGGEAAFESRAVLWRLDDPLPLLTELSVENGRAVFSTELTWRDAYGENSLQSIVVLHLDEVEDFCKGRRRDPPTFRLVVPVISNTDRISRLESDATGIYVPGSARIAPAPGVSSPQIADWQRDSEDWLQSGTWLNGRNRVLHVGRRKGSFRGRAMESAHTVLHAEAQGTANCIVAYDFFATALRCNSGLPDSPYSLAGLS